MTVPYVHSTGMDTMACSTISVAQFCERTTTIGSHAELHAVLCCTAACDIYVVMVISKVCSTRFQDAPHSIQCMCTARSHGMATMVVTQERNLFEEGGVGYMVVSRWYSGLDMAARLPQSETSEWL